MLYCYLHTEQKTIFVQSHYNHSDNITLSYLPYNAASFGNGTVSTDNSHIMALGAQIFTIAICAIQEPESVCTLAYVTK